VDSFLGAKCPARVLFELGRHRGPEAQRDLLACRLLAYGSFRSTPLAGRRRERAGGTCGVNPYKLAELWREGEHQLSVPPHLCASCSKKDLRGSSSLPKRAHCPARVLVEPGRHRGPEAQRDLLACRLFAYGAFRSTPLAGGRGARRRGRGVRSRRGGPAVRGRRVASSPGGPSGRGTLSFSSCARVRRLRLSARGAAGRRL
jgi:hypothetical protein